ncbi:MAG TPA: hypothetical protein VFL95_04710 [Gemmatimonadales bacterium]|nr:hypothetical protein [Gemmatimonadales bacterium]
MRIVPVLALAAAVFVRPASHDAPTQPIRDLIAAGHGAPTVLCALASRSVANGIWGGGWANAPDTPLGSANLPQGRRRDDAPLSDRDRAFLLDSLVSRDDCVRQLDVLLLASYGGDDIAGDLASRLTASDSSVRSVAALGLGLVGAEHSVVPC